jgi:arylsulfatase A-like enzyme
VLDEMSLADNTLLIFTSDNGPWFEGSAAGFRGRKGQSFEGGFRVPFIARWPDRIQAASTSDAPAMNIDIFPTALALANVIPPGDRIIDGSDLMPLMTGMSDGQDRPLFFFHDFDLEAMRLGDWKFLERNSTYAWPAPLDKPTTFAGRAARARHYTPAGEDEAIPTTNTWPRLYHLANDQSESYDVIKKWPERAESMRKQLLSAREELLANPVGWKN